MSDTHHADTDAPDRAGPDGTAAPGLYAIGLRFQYRRDSTLIDGARYDAAYLADQVRTHQSRRA